MAGWLASWMAGWLDGLANLFELTSAFYYGTAVLRRRRCLLISQRWRGNEVDERDRGEKNRYKYKKERKKTGDKVLATNAIPTPNSGCWTEQLAVCIEAHRTVQYSSSVQSIQPIFHSFRPALFLQSQLSSGQTLLLKNWVLNVCLFSNFPTVFQSFMIISCSIE